MRLTKCPHCLNQNPDLLEQLDDDLWFCVVCARLFETEEKNDRRRKGKGNSNSPQETLPKPDNTSGN